jgi:transposase
MMSKTTRPDECTANPTIYLAFELGARTWKLALSTDRGARPRHYTVEAGHLSAVWAAVGRARARWQLGPTTPVVSCYEAGRDGFWLHRALEAAGVRNLVVDPASIERDRRAKAVKTDRVDAERLLELLQRWAAGHQRLRVVRVPSVEEEDARQREREVGVVKGVRVAVRNRITSLLVAQGVRTAVRADFGTQVATWRTGDGRPLPPRLQERLQREWEEVQALTRRIATVEAARGRDLRAGATPAAQQTRALMQLKGIGATSAALFVDEFFAWRRFRNGREVGALAGLTPTPYQSGTSVREQGISKAGNWRVRAMAVEIAWCWLQFQPESTLARWYRRRFGGGPARLRRIGIVALARKLLVALWRYLEAGVIPDGATFKTA